MGVVERKQREKEQRRQSILDKARSLILEKGAAALTMADIADATELSKAALYLYFRSKEELITVILVDATRKFADFIEAKLRQVRTGMEQLTMIARSFLEFYRESEDLFVFSGITADTRQSFTELAQSEQGRRLWGRFEEMIRACLENGARDGSFNPTLDIPQTVRTAMLICTTMVEHLSAIPGRDRDPAMVIREIAGVFSVLRAAVTNKNANAAQFIRDLMP
jgi:AcrR family transcriptional regulator